MCVRACVCVCVDVDVSARVDADEVSTCDTFLAKKKQHCEFPANSIGAQFMSPQRSSSAAHYYHVRFFIFSFLCSNFFYAAAAFSFCGALLSREFFCRFFQSIAAKKHKQNTLNPEQCLNPKP